MNIFQHLIRQAIISGVSIETIVLLLLLPLVVSVVAAARHFIGFRGFGILIPATISVVLAATGIINGILVFLTILLVATFARIVLRKLRLQYLPRMAVVLWLVCLGVLGMIFVFPTTISIFPILILILLAENFIEVQIERSFREAVQLTFETLIIALIGWIILSLKTLQQFALTRPEIVVLIPLIFNILLGRFTGLRLFEYWRFRRLLGR
jgi:hypothetical protein